MESSDNALRDFTLESRALNISRNVRCTECGHQSIEDSHADIAIQLKKLIRAELKTGSSDKEVYAKLRSDFGESVLYTPDFDWPMKVIFAAPLVMAGVAVGGWILKKQWRDHSLPVLTGKLVEGIPFTQRERETMLNLLTPPPSQARYFSWLRR